MASSAARRRTASADETAETGEHGVLLWIGLVPAASPVSAERQVPCRFRFDSAPSAPSSRVSKRSGSLFMSIHRLARAGQAGVLTLCLLQTTAAFAPSPAPVAGENGMVVNRPAAGERSRRRGPEGGRQRGGCRGRRRLRARRHLSDRRQSRRRRLHDDPPQGRALNLHRFSRARARTVDPRHVSRRDGNPVEGLSTDGYLAVGVPGSVAGFEYARERYGTRERPDLLAPAIRLASDGLRALARRCRELPGGQRGPRQGPRGRRDLLESRRRRPTRSASGWCRAISPASCGRSRNAAPTASTAGRPRRRSSMRRGPWRHPRDRRLRGLQGPRTCAHPLRLQGLRDRLLAAAEFGRRHHLRDPQHPEGLPDRLYRVRLGRDRPPDGRGDAPRICRPQLGARRPGTSSRTRSRNSCPRSTRPRSAPRSIPPAVCLGRPQARRHGREPRDDALFDRRQGRQTRSPSPTP